MTQKKHKYKRLPGRGGRIFRYCSLYIGQDHLLSVESDTFGETYRRLYFKDIESIIARKTLDGAIISWFFAILTSLFFLFAAINEWAWLFFAVPLLFILVLCLTRGTTCDCRISTATLTKRLFSLNHLKNATKVMDQLRPLIEKAQGGVFIFETYKGNTPGFKISRDGEYREQVSVPIQNSDKAEPPRITRTQFHKPLFILLLIFAALCAAGFVGNGMFLIIIQQILTMGIAACLAIALVRQANSNVSPALKQLAWVICGFWVVFSVICFIPLITVAFQNPEIAHNQWELLKIRASMSLYDNTFFMIVRIVSIVCYTVLGTMGLLLIRKTKNAFADSVAPPSIPTNENQTMPGES